MKNAIKSQKDIVIVTGVKFSVLKRAFAAGQQVTYIDGPDARLKMNAAAGAVRQLKSSYEVWATTYDDKTIETLEYLQWIGGDTAHTVDLLNKKAVDTFVSLIAQRQTKTGAAVHFVHYGGASDTPIALPNESLLAHTWDIQPDVLPHLVANNCVTLLNTLQSMKRYKLFEGQAVSKVVFISAAAAVRVKQELGLDSAQKGAGHNLIRNIALDLTPENIFVTEIMPGSTDTGFFDNDYTLETAVRITKNLGYHLTKETYPVFTAEQIGDAAKYVLDAKCNVRELVLLPYGQFPHLGA
jgi:NAD(P)-dependent dehydrogenase (short-subunit alcohol dehydrogenase family)